jgi:hypothetical protein
MAILVIALLEFMLILNAASFYPVFIFSHIFKIILFTFYFKKQQII